MPKVTKDKEAMQQRGEILFLLRKKRGVSQTTVAEMVGVSTQAYQKYEYGDADPTIDTLIKLSNFYGVSVYYLLGRDTEPKPLEQLAKISAMDVTEETLVEEYLKLPTESRQIIINFLKNAIKEAEARKGQEKPSIQLHEGQRLAVARTDDPDKLYRPAPTEEQMKQFDLVTPDMLGEDE